MLYNMLTCVQHDTMEIPSTWFLAMTRMCVVGYDEGVWNHLTKAWANSDKLKTDCHMRKGGVVHLAGVGDCQPLPLTTNS